MPAMIRLHLVLFCAGAALGCEGAIDGAPGHDDGVIGDPSDEPDYLHDPAPPGGQPAPQSPRAEPAPHSFPPPVIPGPFATQWCGTFDDRDLTEVAAAGFGGLRIGLNPLSPNLARVTPIVENMWAHGQTPIIILGSDNQNPPRTPEAWQSFAAGSAALASYFAGLSPRGRIVFEIWNEPNGEHFWHHPNAGEYAGLAVTTARALRPYPFAVVAPAVGNVDPDHNLPFLLDVFRAQPDLANQIDAVSVHGYDPTGRASPEARLPRFLRVMQLTGKPLLMSEWGWPSLGGAALPADRVAAYSARMLLLNLSVGVVMSVLYTWRDDSATDPNDSYGLERSDRTARKALFAVKGVIDNLAGFQFLHRARTANAEDIVLVFGRGDEQKVAYWTTGEPHNIRVGQVRLRHADMYPRFAPLAAGTL
jgi:hypothetical protein